MIGVGWFVPYPYLNAAVLIGLEAQEAALSAASSRNVSLQVVHQRNFTECVWRAKQATHTQEPDKVRLANLLAYMAPDCLLKRTRIVFRMSWMS